MGIGFAAAGQYQFSSDQQWKDYENVEVVAALNEMAKIIVDPGIWTCVHNRAGIVKAVAAGSSRMAARIEVAQRIIGHANAKNPDLRDPSGDDATLGK